MSDFYKLRKSGDGYVAHPTTWEQHAADRVVDGAGMGAAYLAGGVLGLGARGVRKVVRDMRDRKAMQLIDEMNAAEAAGYEGHMIRAMAYGVGGHTGIAPVTASPATGTSTQCDDAQKDRSAAEAMSSGEHQSKVAERTSSAPSAKSGSPDSQQRSKLYAIALLLAGVFLILIGAAVDAGGIAVVGL